jgi:hypothetical protein
MKDFMEWSENLINVSTAHKLRWKVSEDKLKELQVLHNEVKALNELCRSASCTKQDMQAKNEKKELLMRLEETFVLSNLNIVLTDNGNQQKKR